MAYLGGTSILVVLPCSTVGLWHRSLGSVALSSITSRRAEAFYWATILFSQTLGTALGDWMADDETGLGLGYDGGALIVAAALGLVVAAYVFTKLNHIALFWIALILTRPLGAMLGDLLDKPLDDGGLALSRYTASAVLGGVMLLAILLLPQRAERRHDRP